MAAWLWLIFTLAAIAACAYALFGAALLRQFDHKRPVAASLRPTLSLVKPRCGPEAGLDADLISVCNQDYGAPIQLVLELENDNDPARAVAERVKTLFPDRDIEVVIDSRQHGANPKISNLI